MKVFGNIGKIFSFLLLAYCAFLIYEWSASKDEVQNLCLGFKAGQHIDEVIGQVKVSKYSRYRDFHDKNKTIILIHSPANMGRYTCFVEYKERKVVNLKYSFLD